MLRSRGARRSRMVYYGIGLLCLCVMMYVLGSTMTLWTMQFALDHTDNPLLEGFSLPTVVSDVTPAMSATPCCEISPGVRTNLNEHSLLRPPNPAS